MATASIDSPPQRPAVTYRTFGALRTVLALLVLIWHSADVSPIRNLTPAGLQFGPLAVFVFFVLSGFVITEAVLAFYQQRPAGFIANRLVRLYPPYVVALILVAGILAFDGAQTPLPHAWDMPANLITNLFAIFPVVPLTDRLLGIDHRIELVSIIWSVRIEFAFYIAVSIALTVSCVLRAPKWRDAMLLVGCTAMLMIHFVLFHLQQSQSRLGFYTNFAPHFVVGVAMALIAQTNASRLAWPAVLVLALPLATIQAVAYPSMRGADALLLFAMDAAHILPAALYLLSVLLIAVLAGVHPRSKKALRWDKSLGEWSYPIYLLHIPSLYFVQKLTLSSTYLNLAAVFTTTLVLAWLTTRLSRLILDPVRRRVRKHALPAD